MNRHPTRLPSARQSSSSADVWWISSTTSVSVGENVAVLEPAPRDSGRDDDDVPRRRFGRRFALAIDDADAQLFGVEDCLGDRPDRERLPGSRSGDDAESLARGGKRANLLAVLLLEDVSMWSPSASSIVSHAARVGAMTMMRPVGGSAATNASWSGGRYLS